MFVACSHYFVPFLLVSPRSVQSSRWSGCPKLVQCPLPLLMFTDGSTSIILGANIHTYKIRTHSAHIRLHIRSLDFMNSWQTGMGHFIFWVCISMSDHISWAHSGSHKYHYDLKNWLITVYLTFTHTDIHTHTHTCTGTHTHTHMHKHCYYK